MSNKKALKIEAVKTWINTLATDKYGMGLLQSYNGDELDKMSIKEIEMLLNFIKATYHHAYLMGANAMKE